MADDPSGESSNEAVKSLLNFNIGYFGLSKSEGEFKVLVGSGWLSPFSILGLFLF